MELAKKAAQCIRCSLYVDVVMCRPDGEKKAYVRLLADYDALDVANKVCYYFSVCCYSCIVKLLASFSIQFSLTFSSSHS